MSIANGVIKKGEKVPCPVDNQGQFTEEVTDFKGLYVKVRYSHTAYCSLSHNYIDQLFSH